MNRSRLIGARSFGEQQFLERRTGGELHMTSQAGPNSGDCLVARNHPDMASAHILAATLRELHPGRPRWRCDLEAPDQALHEANPASVVAQYASFKVFRFGHMQTAVQNPDDAC